MRSSGGRRLAFSVALFLLCASSLPGAFAADVIAVRSPTTHLYDQAIDGFRETCGCTVKVVGYSAGLLDTLHRDRPAAVLAVGSLVFRLLKGEMKGIPLCYVMVLPSELTGPMGNSAGVSAAVAPRIWIDAVQGLLEGVKRIGIIYSERNSGPYARDIAERARRKGVETILREARSPKEVSCLIELFHDIDAFLLLPDVFVADTEAINYIMLHCYQKKIPVVSFTKRHLAMGALLSLDIDMADTGKQAGELARASRWQGRCRSGKNEYARSASVSINFELAEKLKIRLRENNKGAKRLPR